MSKKVAQVIVETLQSAGVKNCYGIVGDTLNQFAASLSRSDIKFVHMRHEEAGAYAAQAEALLMDDFICLPVRRCDRRDRVPL